MPAVVSVTGAGLLLHLPLLHRHVNNIIVTPLRVLEHCKATTDNVKFTELLVVVSEVTFLSLLQFPSSTEIEQCQSANLGRRMKLEANLEEL